MLVGYIAGVWNALLKAERRIPLCAISLAAKQPPHKRSVLGSSPRWHTILPPSYNGSTADFDSAGGGSNPSGGSKNTRQEMIDVREITLATFLNGYKDRDEYDRDCVVFENESDLNRFLWELESAGIRWNDGSYATHENPLRHNSGRPIYIMMTTDGKIVWGDKTSGYFSRPSQLCRIRYADSDKDFTAASDEDFNDLLNT